MNTVVKKISEGFYSSLGGWIFSGALTAITTAIWTFRKGAIYLIKENPDMAFYIDLIFVFSVFVAAWWIWKLVGTNHNMKNNPYADYKSFKGLFYKNIGGENHWMCYPCHLPMMNTFNYAMRTPRIECPACGIFVNDPPPIPK